MPFSFSFHLIDSEWFYKEMAWNLGGDVQKADHREYGSADITINTFGGGAVDALFEGLGNQMRVSRCFFRRLKKKKTYLNDVMNKGLDVPCR